MPYPTNLISYLNRVSNVSKNDLKVTPYRTDAVKNGQILVVDMPSNAMIDLDTLVMSFLGSTTATTGYCAFPRHIESIISKISVELNGLSIGSCNYLSDLYNIMYNLTQGSDLEQKRKLYQNAAAQTSAPNADQTDVPFKIQNWLGFIGSVKPRILDLGVIGQMRIHIFLEGTNVLTKSSDCAGPEFTLNDIYFTVSSVSIDDGIYYSAKSAFLQGGGIIEMPFDNYYASLFSVSSFTQSSRFSVSTNSLDYLLAAFPKYRTIQELDATQDTTAYFKYSAMSNSTNYLSDWNFSVNNVQLPQFKAKIDDAYPLLLNAMGISQTTDGGICSSIISADVWKTNFWVAGVRLDLLAPEDERTISGLNTLGTNATITFESSAIGSYNPENLLVIAKTTPVLRCGAGKSLELVL